MNFEAAMRAMRNGDNLRRASWRKSTLFVSMKMPPGETVSGFFVYFNRFEAEGSLTFLGLFRCRHHDMLADDWVKYEKVRAQAWGHIKHAIDKSKWRKKPEPELGATEHAIDNV